MRCELNPVMLRESFHIMLDEYCNDTDSTLNTHRLRFQRSANCSQHLGAHIQFTYKEIYIKTSSPSVRRLLPSRMLVDTKMRTAAAMYWYVV